MTFIVLFSFILLAWTLLVGIGASDVCIIQISSKYSRESQYCISVLEHVMKNKDKANVCNETLHLFDEICSFNRSGMPFFLPEIQNVTNENCVMLCANIGFKYISSMADSSNATCTTLCTVDPEAVAVLSTLFQLKKFIADSKQEKVQKVVTVTNSTPVQLSTLTSEVAVEQAVSEEPDVESTTTGVRPTKLVDAKAKNSSPEMLQQLASPSNAAGNNNSAPKEEDGKEPIKAAGNNNSAPKEDGKEPIIAAGNNNSAPKEDEKKTTIATRRMSLSTTKSDGNSTTTGDAGEMKTLPTKKDVKPATTAAGQNYSTTEEPDLTATSTALEGKGLPPTEPNLERSTTVQRKQSSTRIAVTQATTEMDKEYDSNEGLDFDSENTNEEADGSDKNDEINEEKSVETDVDPDEHPSLGNEPSKTGEKDETSKLDDTPSSYHFLIYFLAFIVLCVAAYIVFHNKHKIIAFIIEGKQGRRGGRPSTKQYTPLKSKVEDVMPFIEKSTTQSNYIY